MQEKVPTFLPLGGDPTSPEAPRRTPVCLACLVLDFRGHSGEPPKVRGCRHCNALQPPRVLRVWEPGALVVSFPQGPTGTRHPGLWPGRLCSHSHPLPPGSCLGGDQGCKPWGGDPTRQERNTGGPGVALAVCVECCPVCSCGSVAWCAVALWFRVRPLSFLPPAGRVPRPVAAQPRPTRLESLGCLGPLLGCGWPRARTACEVAPGAQALTPCVSHALEQMCIAVNHALN